MLIFCIKIDKKMYFCKKTLLTIILTVVICILTGHIETFVVKGNNYTIELVFSLFWPFYEQIQVGVMKRGDNSNEMQNQKGGQ